MLKKLLYDTLCDLACRGKISFIERNNLLKSLENIESEDILLDNDKEN